MKVEISNGELLDKLSILHIKQKRITDESKLQNIRAESIILQNVAAKLLENSSVFIKYALLAKVNEKLWDIEDSIRRKENSKSFDEEFIELARNVYITNDLRASIKREINEITGSEIVEEKSYTQYK